MNLTPKTKTRISRLLSLALRHHPEALGVTVDEYGWARVGGLLEGLAARGLELTSEQLQDIVETNEKGRFRYGGDGKFLQACQGHTLDVILDLRTIEAPRHLYHGTSDRFLAAILEEGLRPMKRHQVHLSRDRETAVAVGRRHGGETIILQIEAAKLQESGMPLFESHNGVVLVDRVPPPFLSIIG